MTLYARLLQSKNNMVSWVEEVSGKNMDPTTKKQFVRGAKEASSGCGESVLCARVGMPFVC